MSNSVISGAPAMPVESPANSSISEANSQIQFTPSMRRFAYFSLLLVIGAIIYYVNRDDVNKIIWWFCYMFIGGLIPLFLAAYFVYPALSKEDRVNIIFGYLMSKERTWKHVLGPSDRDSEDSDFISSAAKQANNAFKAHLSVANHILPVIFISIVALGGSFVLFSYINPLWEKIDVINGHIKNIPTSVLYGFVGSNLFVLYSIVKRFRTIDITPITILGMSYQIILATTAAYIIVKFSDDATINALIAFSIGFVPFSDLAKWFTDTAKKKLGQKPLVDPHQDKLQQKESENLFYLKGISREDSERLREEGLFTTHDLALSNPMTLYITTPFKMSQIVEWINQAYLQTFLSSTEMEAIAPMGIRGAMGVRVKARESIEKGPDHLEKFIDTLAQSTNQKKEVIESLVERLTNDPRVMLLEALWLRVGSE